MLKEKHPIPRWSCQVVKKDQGFLSSFEDTSHYLVANYNGDRIDVFVVKQDITADLSVTLDEQEEIKERANGSKLPSLKTNNQTT